jgi:hypothetical protein
MDDVPHLEVGVCGMLVLEDTAVVLAVELTELHEVIEAQVEENSCHLAVGLSFDFCVSGVGFVFVTD